MKAPAREYPPMPVPASLRFGNIEVRPGERQLLVDGEPAKLGARAFDVLLALIERRERTVSKNELLDLVWPGLVVEENNLQVHISALRKLLGPAMIATIPGRGYRFTQTPEGAAAGARAAPALGTATVAAVAAPGDPSAELLPLLGRDEDLDAVRALVETHRVVTIAGAGGIGKTTLARALAHRVRDTFEDGVCTVELAPVSDPSLVATTVASALQIKLGNQPALKGIAQALGARRLLVVLDNCEHLVRAVAELVEALRPAASRVHWLATSQEALKLAGEQVYRLGALALPDEETVDAARKAGAVALFEARAREADPRFALTGTNVSAVIGICRDLDGIALAIELAAARVPLLGVEGLRRRLGERLRVLTSGTRLALPRHQTLRAALEWSHALLTPAQQTVFRRLGVFAGSFALDAAQQVAADDTIDAWSVLDDLGALIDKSLVAVLPDAPGEPRYRLLETMRQYALDRLEAAGDGGAARTRHLDVFVALAEQAKAESIGPRQAIWMRRLDLEHENVLAAHAWCLHVADGGGRDLRLVTGLDRYWLNRALLSLGYRVTSEALNRPGAERRDDLRCTALMLMGRLGSRIGLYAQVRRELDESVAIAREIGRIGLLASALSNLGGVYHEQGNLAGARAALEEALPLARDPEAGSAVFGKTAILLGELERAEGNWAPAQSLYEEALADVRRRGDLSSIRACLNNLAMVAIAQGQVANAHERLIEAIVLDDLNIGYARMIPLLICAGLEAVQERWQQSARFEAAATFHLVRLGWPLDPADKAFVDSFRTRTREALGHETFDAAQASGRALKFDEALIELHQWLQDAP
jgi:predicted ATPase/DNA-binding winged helix-turn-helix (wHTH) protein